MNDAATWETVRGFLPAAADHVATVTFFDRGQPLTVAVARDEAGNLDIVDAANAQLGLAAIATGDTIIVLVDSYSDELSHIDDDGNLITWVTARAWGFVAGIGDPLPAADVRYLFGINHATGEPLADARGIHYADGWLLTGNPGGR